MHEKSLTELRAALAAKDCSAVELAQLYLKRIEAANSLNAFVQGPLLGLPIAHKDVFVTRGWKSTAGSKMLAGYQSPVRRDGRRAACRSRHGLRRQDEYGRVRDGLVQRKLVLRPRAAIPGTAARARRLVGRLGRGRRRAARAGATGTDTGGSIRQPAAFTGITGLKPTYGRVSRYGMIAFASSLDQGGPVRPLGALTARCCSTAWRASIHATRQVSSIPMKTSPAISSEGWNGSTDAARPLAGLRIGLPDEYFGDGLAPDVHAAIEAALKEYEALGAVRVRVSLPKTELSIPVYYVIAPAEASSNLSRFDGVRFGHRAAQYGDLLDMYKKSRSEGFGEEVKRRILVGAYVLGVRAQELLLSRSAEGLSDQPVRTADGRKGGIVLDDGSVKTIGITRAHLEEDAGKSLHEGLPGMPAASI
jgi:aspartyl-tRNA(Asn)/glutamyl-tRNA(Gln) amidotransferase subunit A